VSVNILIVDKDHNEHPDWNPYINGGHKQFARKVLPTLPRVEDRIGSPPDLEYLIRPADFEEWRRVLKQSFDFNEELWAKMVNILESDNKWWIYISQ
jgi:hypothetical protein